MAQSTLTFTLANQANVTCTLLTTDFPSAQSTLQAMIKNGGVWCPSNVAGATNPIFYPVSQILYVTVT